MRCSWPAVVWRKIISQPSSVKFKVKRSLRRYPRPINVFAQIEDIRSRVPTEAMLDTTQPDVALSEMDLFPLCCTAFNFATISIVADLI